LGIEGLAVVLVIGATLLPMARAQRSEKADAVVDQDVITDPNTNLQFRKVKKLVGNLSFFQPKAMDIGLDEM